MINEYNIIRKNVPSLIITKSIDEYSIYKDSQYLVDILNKYYYMDQLDNEQKMVVALDNNGNMIGFFVLSKGNSSSTKNNRRGLAIFLSLIGAEKFVIVHNHPTHDLDLNQSDKLSMEYDKYVGDLLEIELLADIVISQYGWRDFLSGEVYEQDGIENIYN